MNTTVLFMGGLMLGVLVTLTIVSHRYSSERSSIRPSPTHVRPSSKRDPLTVTAGGLKPEKSLEELLKGSTPPTDKVSRASLSGHDKMDVSFSARATSISVPGTVPRKVKSKVPLVAEVTSSWAPGGRGALNKYAERAERASALFGGGRAASLQPGGTKGGVVFVEESAPKRTQRAIGIGSNDVKSGAQITELAASFKDVPYHLQAHRAPVTPRKLDYNSCPEDKRPDMTGQKAAHEKENLKLHLCNSVFEAYSASYLTTKEHLIDVKSENYNLTWVNCEMASFIHMRHSPNFFVNAAGKGMIMQSLDVLDFSVIHLSAFERSSRRWKDKLWFTPKERKTAWHNIDAVKEAAQVLEQLVNPKVTGRKLIYSPEALKTVVVMPFLGGAMGAGHSELGNRFEYLKACFWSFYEFVPNIVAGVSRQEDVDWAFKESGLPFYDIILIDNLPKSAGLPVGTTQQVKKRLLSGKYDFDYIFFTESDQILITRELQLMYENLKEYPHRMILPHRLMPYSDRVVKEVHKRQLLAGRNAWMNQSCCMPRQNCGERKSWKPLRDDAVPVVNYHGLNIPLGNVNFLDESYRYCKLGSFVDICP